MLNNNDLDLLQIPVEVIERHLFQKSYYEFFKAAMQVMEPETEWQFNWHIEYICDILQAEVERIIAKKPKKNDLDINVPPGSSKSSMVSVCLLPWAWTIAPYLRVANSSYNEALSAEHTRKARDLILTRWYQKRFGGLFKLTKETETYFINDKGGIRKSGINTGWHFDVLIFDDQLSPKLALSEPEREKAARQIFKVAPTRLRNIRIGLKINLSQRVHELDTSGQIRRKKLNYKHIVIPAVFSKKVEPVEIKKYYKDGLFWPERYNKKTLDEKKRELSEAEYSGQYEQNPVPADGLVFKREWLTKRFTRNELPENIARHFYTDSAFGVEGGDNSATACWSIFQGNIFIWDMLVINSGLSEWSDQYKRFVEINKGDWKSAHFVENKASGYDIADVLAKETGYNMIMHKLPGNQSKRMRAEACTPTVRAGKVYLLQDGLWVESFIEELAAFPKAAHDDQVDTLSGLIANSDLSMPIDDAEDNAKNDTF